jgi:hypothetical protein
VEGARLNAAVARRTAVLNNKNAMMVPSNVESFITRPLPDTPSSTQLSLVAEARDIEKRQYIYAIFRIIYLVVGIAMVSYFVYQTVGSPDSTILEDAKLKAEQLKTKLPGVGGDVQQTERMNEPMNVERRNM